MDKIETDGHAEVGSGDGDRVEDPRPSLLGGEGGGGLHGEDPVGGEGANVDAEGVCVWGEIRDLL